MEENTLSRVTPKQAAKELNMDIDTFYYLMQKERLPIGFALKKDGNRRYSYIIYRSMLDAYKKTIKEAVDVQA